MFSVGDTVEYIDGDMYLIVAIASTSVMIKHIHDKNIGVIRVDPGDIVYATINSDIDDDPVADNSDDYYESYYPRYEEETPESKLPAKPVED